MTNLLKVLLSLTLSGTLLILFFFLCKPIWKDRLSKQWQYYIWLIVIIRLLLPFSMKANFIGTVFQQMEEIWLQEEQNILGFSNFSTETGQQALISENNNSEYTETSAEAKNPMLTKNTLPISMCIIFIWLMVALILFVRKITIYQGFARYIKAGQEPVDNIETLNQFSILLSKAGIQKNIELATNSLISSPFLMGFFRPCIILPTVAVTDVDFCNTIQHEITHYKRRDLLYKWLVQFVTCIHWFNPFIYLMGREINCACELSCDEAVIHHMNAEEKAAYGDTLLNAMGYGGSYKDSRASVTLRESKKLLKERLRAIMGFKKKSKAIVSVTLLLTVFICFSATFVGAYVAPAEAVNKPSCSGTSSKGNSNSTGETSLSVSSRDTIHVNFSGVSLTGQGPVGVELVRTRNENVTFELLNIDNEKNCTTNANIVNGIMEISIHNNATNGLNVNFGPEYKNVVRVYIPDAVYQKFDIASKEMMIQMQDFNAPVKVKSNRAGFWLIDTTISQGTYDIETYSGPIYIEANTILSDITAHADSGPLTIRFNQEPQNLALDTTKCGPVVIRPDSWPAIYKIGTENPKITLSNTGKAAIYVTNPEAIQSSITDVEITEIKPAVMKDKKYGIDVSFSNLSEETIQNIFVRLKFPDHENAAGIHADLNTKGENSWSLNMKSKASYFWPFSSDNAGSFKMAITAYLTTGGKLHTIPENQWKWVAFYYPGKDGIGESSASREIFTSHFNEKEYGKQYFVMNLAAGDPCTAHLSWDGNGKVYFVYVDGIGFQTDKNNNILLSQFSKDNADYFAYEIPNNETVTFTVPKDGLYVVPVRDNSNIASNINGTISYYVY